MRKKFLLAGFSVIAIVGMLFAMFPQDSQAIPPFARKYKTSCTTCHWGTWPKLNAFGKAFRANGLRMPGGGDEVFVKEEPVKMGASAWSKLFPKAIWPGDIPMLPAIGILTKFDYTYTRERPQDYRGGDGGSPQRENVNDTQFNGFDKLEVLVGATFGETLSFFAAGSWDDLERAYLNYAPYIFGEQGLLNIRIGKFDTRANPVSNHLRQIRKHGYLMNEFPTVATGNFFGFHPNQRGIEFWGSKNGPKGKGGLEWAVGIVNGHWGEGDAHFNGVSDGDVDIIKSNMEGKGLGIGKEINNGKDWYATVSYKIGGMGVLSEESVDDSLVAKDNWQDNSVRIKGYYYRGTTGAFIDDPSTGEFGNPLDGTGLFDDNANRFKRYGVVVEANWWNFAFTGVASFMEDDISSGTITYAADASKNLPQESGSSFDTTIYTGEASWVALPWLIPSVRVENVNPDYAARDIKSFTKYTFETRLITRANTFLTVGGSWTNYTDNQSGSGGDVPRLDLERATDTLLWIGSEVAF